MNLSIIIVSWNTMALLDACLGSIYAHPPARSFEVLVVDNASTDGSREMIQNKYPAATLITSTTNLGFARANNLALSRSTGDFLLLLNPDTELHEGALDTLLTFLMAHPDAGAVGARLLNSDGTLQHSCSRAPTLGRELVRLFHLDPLTRYAMERWSISRPRKVDVLLGACIVLRREALDEVGELDEGYFMYSEEVDLCERVRRAGWNIYWEPRATVIHHGGQSTRQVAMEMFLQLYRAKVRYFRKHGGAVSARAYKSILATAALTRLAVSPLALLEPAQRRDRHQALTLRYWRLLRSLPSF